MALTESELIFDWNTLSPRPANDARIPETFDESLRDGIQSPSVIDPTIEKKKELLVLMDRLGITAADISLPGAGARQTQDAAEMVRFIRDQKLKIQPACAGRTVVKDLEPIAQIQQQTGMEVTAYAFLGTSPIRQYAEAWDLDRLIRSVDESLTWAQKHQVPVAFVTEDTVRSKPDTLDKLFRAAINLGARRLVLCDTVGHATPDGVRALVAWTRALVRDMRSDVKIDWHGHNDRGLGVINTLAAFEAGADRLHGTAMGVGERVGNAALDQVLLNLKLMGNYPHDLSALVEYCRVAGHCLGVEIPYNYPLAGRDAFRTATGVHAAAVIKAELKGDAWLADRIYSGVPAATFGKSQEIEIGPMSGMSNVRYWLKKHGVKEDERLCQAVLDGAKVNDRVLTEDELWAMVRKHGAGAVA